MTRVETMLLHLVSLALSVFVISLNAYANPIPVPVPASMPLEEMAIVIDRRGNVDFSGDFTFDFIPDGNVCPADECEVVTKMQFPLPPINATNVAVQQDGSPLAWSLAAELYPTILPEYPLLEMFEWFGPFPVDGAVFTVDYEHDVFQRGAEQVFFYSLGTGKYFPTYDKITTAILDIELPVSARQVGVFLDDMQLDPGDYSLVGNQLDLTLTSDFGPFTKDLIVTYRVPLPGTIWLLSAGCLALFRAALAGRARHCGEAQTAVAESHRDRCLMRSAAGTITATTSPV
jgi:hypothetical protein